MYCYEQLLLFRHLALKRLQQNTLASEWSGSDAASTPRSKVPGNSKNKAQKKLQKMQRDFLSTLTDAEMREVSAVEEGIGFGLLSSLSTASAGRALFFCFF